MLTLTKHSPVGEESPAGRVGPGGLILNPWPYDGPLIAVAGSDGMRALDTRQRALCKEVSALIRHCDKVAALIAGAE